MRCRCRCRCRCREVQKGQSMILYEVCFEFQDLIDQLKCQTVALPGTHTLLSTWKELLLHVCQAAITALASLFFKWFPP